MSLRTKLLILVVLGALAPLAITGFWLTRIAARSGEEVLYQRLDAALLRGVAEIGTRWIRYRSALLTVAESDTAKVSGDLTPVVRRAVLRDPGGGIRWRIDSSDSADQGVGSQIVTVHLEVFEPGSARTRARLEADLRADAILGAAGAVGAGAVLGAFDRATGVSLLPLPFESDLLARSRFEWGGDSWRVARLALDQPPIELAAAAPLGPFTTPFRRAAQGGAVAFLAVALLSAALAVLLTARMTRSLGRLADAADAVSRGDLDVVIDEGSQDEVGRVGRAFSQMTQSLRRTLDQLAHREALAAVGHFAAGLAHEIRNPLSAIRLDLQRVEETLPNDSPARRLQARALGEVDRLDQAVTGALRLARSGQVRMEPLDLLVPLRAALDAAQPAFASAGGVVAPFQPVMEPILIRGDPAALEQALLNLLLNAAQALQPGGRATVKATVGNSSVIVKVHDDGPGIPHDRLERVFEPFFSTKPGGTGLGLAIARQIILAHRGDLRIESMEGKGTTVLVTLPLVQQRSDRS